VSSESPVGRLRNHRGDEFRLWDLVLCRLFFMKFVRDFLSVSDGVWGQSRFCLGVCHAAIFKGHHNKAICLGISSF
jgi:hypothetical protein